MNKTMCISIILLMILMFITACSSIVPKTDETDTKVIITDTTDKLVNTDGGDTAETTNILGLCETMEFSFLSGAGGWCTTLVLSADGSFAGQYLNSEMGAMGEGYPNGSAYICNFSGKFEIFEKLDEYSYKMTLADIKTEKTVGEEWITDEIRYIASDPYGLEDGIEFILYLPDTPIADVSEKFLSWWPYRYTQITEPKDTLSCYGIFNVTTGYGFFAE